MNWLPLPSDFRAGLRAATGEPHAETRLRKLAALAGCRLDFVQTIQLGQAIRKWTVSGSERFPRVRLALLASSTVDHLGPALEVAMLRRALQLDLYLAPYGQYRQALLDPGSRLYEHRPEFVLWSLTARDVMDRVPLTASRSDAETAIGGVVEDIRSLWRIARERLGAEVIQQTCLNVAEPLFGSYERQVAGAPATAIARLNECLVAAAERDGVLLLDIARASERDGLDAWFDRGRWLQGKMEIAPQAAPQYGELAARVIGAARGLSKKCLVLDLDNTLWGGVVGDDGVQGLVLGEGSGAGEAYLALQRYARELRERGVVLAICSKNDPVVAESAFRDHPEMVLTPSDIAVFVANWEDKASNLVHIAERLNVGVDSLVFVDDHPVERARVRQELPMVAVPELPDDPALYVRCLADAGYFEAVAFTKEDTQRGRQYAENATRDALRDQSSSLDEFLAGLEMKVVFGPFQSVDLQRIAQLIGKTNQFNVTTRRHSLQHVTAVSAAEDAMTLQFRLVDRFGDNGLVSAMILCPVADEPGTLEIDTWVMSCRVFARQLEQEAMNIAVENARARRVRRLRACYIPTPRNAVVKDLFRTLGFSPAGSSSSDESTRWCLDVEDYVPAMTRIAREAVGQ
ncbi:MAG TPA: HAD-IIIC family phosphatase [Gemmatimonadales bacterium]|nr:HAD-IIIC family phosphatase [Gemmatimonadales bacterium]